MGMRYEYSHADWGNIVGIEEDADGYRAGDINADEPHSIERPDPLAEMTDAQIDYALHHETLTRDERRVLENEVVARAQAARDDLRLRQEAAAAEQAFEMAEADAFEQELALKERMRDKYDDPTNSWHASDY